MSPLSLDPKQTALVLIDLQRGIAARQCAPHSSATVIANAVQLAARFRELQATVVLVHVAFHADLKDMLNVSADAPAPFNPAALPPNWSEIVPELGPQPGDLRITKHQWGAFYGTELDLQLRRRGVRTISSAASLPTLASNPPRAPLMNAGITRFLSKTPCPV